MATALDSQYLAATNLHFQFKIAEAVASAAVAVSSEATTTPNHANRVAYAKIVFSLLGSSQPPDNALILAWAVALASQGVDDSATDAVINSSVSSLWNGFAGAQ